MLFLVATNVVASRPPKRRPTGTPHARANNFFEQIFVGIRFLIKNDFLQISVYDHYIFGHLHFLPCVGTSGGVAVGAVQAADFELG